MTRQNKVAIVQNKVALRKLQYQTVDFINRTRRNRKNARKLAYYSVDRHSVGTSFIENIFGSENMRSVNIGRQHITLHLTNNEILVVNNYG